MIQIGKYKLGFAPVSMIAVFIVLSVCAIVAAFRQDSPYCSMPLWGFIVINESMALAATLVYGIFAHFAIVIINKLKNR